MFIYHYNQYYDLGIRKKQKSYALTYKEMEKVARKIVLCFIVFLGTTWIVCLAEYDRFLVCLMKGVLVDIVVVPLLSMHYGDESKYKFKNL